MPKAAMPSGPLCTRRSLAADFARLGVTPGDTLLVHSSLSSIGWVCGGAEAVVQALLDTLERDGTLVVPTHSSDNSDPAQWENPPVPRDWFETIRATMPAYDPVTRPSWKMGAIAEMVRTWPRAVRSAHPQSSFAAIGPAATVVTANHALDSRLGEQSPLARLEENGARILLLGVGFDRCTAFHLAEYRLGRPKVPNSFAIQRGQGREWATVQDIDPDGDRFEHLGRDFERDGPVVKGSVGAAQARLFSLRDAVAYAQTWLADSGKDA